MTLQELLIKIDKNETPIDTSVIVSALIKSIEEQEPKQCSETELLNRTYSL